MDSQQWVVIGLVALAGTFLVWRLSRKDSQGACGCSGGCCGKRKS